MQFLDPKNDVAFKKLFGSNEHKNLTISFLNSILEYTDKKAIVDVHFLNTEQHPFIIKEKKENYLDVLCTDQSGKKYIVEMQVEREEGFAKRIVYYGTKTYAMQLGVGRSYLDCAPVIVLAIVNFTMFAKKEHFKSIHKLLDEKTHEHDLQEITFAFVELKKFNKKENELVTAEDRWIYFMRNIEKQDHVPAPLKQNEFREACDIVERMKWSEASLDAYNDAFIKETALQATLAAERKEGRKEVALNLLTAGLDIKAIAAATQLSVEEVQALKKK